MHAAGKIFVKTYPKAIRDTFFSQNVEFPSMWYFYPTEGESLYFFFESKKFTACKTKGEKE